MLLFWLSVSCVVFYWVLLSENGFLGREAHIEFAVFFLINQTINAESHILRVEKPILGLITIFRQIV
jgi:hypothetical protein